MIVVLAAKDREPWPVEVIDYAKRQHQSCVRGRGMQYRVEEMKLKVPQSRSFAFLAHNKCDNEHIIAY